MDLSAGLYHHVRFNHYPPPSSEQIDNIVSACALAIEKINAGEPDAIVCKVNDVDTTASKIAEDWHLWDQAFINQEVLDEQY
jgi:hypothetical protein